MKLPLFIANAVGAVLLFNFLINPSITGFAVAEDTGFGLASPLGFSIAFIVVVIALDVYSYVRSRQKA
ncbi:MAG TPA: hypothetical protein VFF28_01170 [Candidatus Nanoarchaeia archaeon]|nr:hypothetical protein [Candidatus Nanoarchaeia archaeon]